MAEWIEAETAHRFVERNGNREIYIDRVHPSLVSHDFMYFKVYAIDGKTGEHLTPIFTVGSKSDNSVAQNLRKARIKVNELQKLTTKEMKNLFTLREFDEKLSKLSEFKVVDSLPKETVKMLVGKIHEVRVLCEENKLPPTVTDSIISKFIFDMEVNFGYELLCMEDTQRQMDE